MVVGRSSPRKLLRSLTPALFLPPFFAPLVPGLLSLFGDLPRLGDLLRFEAILSFFSGAMLKETYQVILRAEIARGSLLAVVK
mmetsp:Transcript_4860/g.13809  ORF Transcript_4860/g.13809 Transcript_4860/m.13809 type:complete len:83 (+) Transcript_4860:151-399(+)